MNPIKTPEMPAKNNEAFVDELGAINGSDDVQGSPEQPGVEAFRRLLFLCVPPKTYGQVRLGPATHRRFVATVWVVAPEVFEGMSQARMAAMLGMSEDRFKKLCAVARTAIDSRRRR